MKSCSPFLIRKHKRQELYVRIATVAEEKRRHQNRLCFWLCCTEPPLDGQSTIERRLPNTNLTNDSIHMRAIRMSAVERIDSARIRPNINCRTYSFLKMSAITKSSIWIVYPHMKHIKIDVHVCMLINVHVNNKIYVASGERATHLYRTDEGGN